MKDYQVIAGTSYDSRTSPEVIRVLENARLNRCRVHISLGETSGPQAGKDWLEEHDCHGYIGRSMGPVKVPLLVANRRSMGGGAILDHCIVRIRMSAGGRVLYQHPSYHHGNLEIRPNSKALPLSDDRLLAVDLMRDGELHASFDNVKQARQWATKLGVTAPIIG